MFISQIQNVVMQSEIFWWTITAVQCSDVPHNHYKMQRCFTVCGNSFHRFKRCQYQWDRLLLTTRCYRTTSASPIFRHMTPFPQQLIMGPSLDNCTKALFCAIPSVPRTMISSAIVIVDRRFPTTIVVRFLHTPCRFAFTSLSVCVSCASRRR